MTTLITHRHRPHIEPAPRELLWLAAVIALTAVVIYGQNLLA